MAKDNISAPFFITSSAITAIPGSAISGSFHGASQAVGASTAALQELNSEGHSSLRALEVICKKMENLQADEVAGLNLFHDDLQALLLPTANSAASVASKLSVTPAIVATNLSQLPSDVWEAIQALFKSINDYNQFTRTKEASTLDIEREREAKKSDFFANCQALCKHSSDIFDQLEKDLKQKFEGEGSIVKSHSRIAMSTATAVSVSGVGTAGFVSLLCDVIGSIFRETQALINFSNQESLSEQEQNVYKAFSDCCASLYKSNDCNQSLIALRKLEEAVSNFKPAREMSAEHSATSPSISVFLRSITAMPFVKTLRAVNSAALALNAAHDEVGKKQDKLSQNSRESAAKASLLNGFSGGDAKHHSQNVSDFLANFDNAIGDIDNALQAIENQDDRNTVASSAKSTLRFEGAVGTAVSLVTGLVGFLPRELTGTGDFTTNDKGIGDESAIVLESRKDLTGADLDNLMSRAIALQERLDRCQKLGVSAPVVLGVTHAATCGALIGTLNVVAGMYSALREIKSFSVSPSAATKLDEDEEAKAVKYVESAIASNNKTGGTVGTEAISEDLSLQKHLASVMEKVVLTHRSHRNFLQPGIDRQDINSVAKSSVASIQGNSIGFLSGAMGIIALTALQTGMSLEAIFGAIRLSLAAKRASDGVDNSVMENGCKSNVSFATNITRLIADKADNSSTAQTLSSTTFHGVETTASRSLMVFLCNSGILKEALRNLTRQEQDALVPMAGFADSTVLSANIMPKLADRIVAALNKAEEGRNQIPGLNQAMASQLGFDTNASIAAALSTHSVAISSFLQSIAAAKHACEIKDEERNEALSDNSVGNSVSKMMNIIQAFTNNCIKGFNDLNGENSNQHDNAIMDAHISLNHRSARSMAASCCLTLLTEEILEMLVSRSLALHDEKKIEITAKETREQTKKHSDLSQNAITEDTGPQDSQSIIHGLLALRLTLSHFGVSLGNFADALSSHFSDNKFDLMKDDLRLHQSQQLFLTSMTSALTECGLSMVSIAGLISRLPLSSVGTVDSLWECIHSIDDELMSRRIKNSEDSTRYAGSDTLVVTGIVTDSISNILVLATKIALRLTILGLDTSLSVAKLLEILCLHPRPDAALSLEAQAQSQPNGFSKNTREMTQEVSIGSSVVVAGMMAGINTTNSTFTQEFVNSFQAVADETLENTSLLADAEEDSLNLKKFYEILIRLLVAHQNASYRNAPLSASDAEYRDLVRRLDFGNLPSASYHSDYAGVPGFRESKNISNPLIARDCFLKCKNAGMILTTFINKAYIDEAHGNKRVARNTLLDKLKTELAQNNEISAKTQKSWRFIVNSVIDRQIKDELRHSARHPENVLENKKNWGGRRADLLNNWEVAIDKTEEEHLQASAISSQV